MDNNELQTNNNNNKFIPFNLMKETFKNSSRDDFDQSLDYLVKNGYIIEGYNDKPEPVENTLSNRLSGRVEDIKKEIAGENTDNIGGRLLRGAGAVAGGVGDVVGAGVETAAELANDASGGLLGKGISKLTELGQIIAEKGGEKVAEPIVSNIIEPLIRQYETADEITQKNIDSVANILSLLPIGKGAKVAKDAGENTILPAVKAAKDAGVDTIKKGLETGSKKISELYDISPEKAVNIVKDNLEEQITGLKSNKRAVDKLRTDVLDTIAKNPDYHPNINVDNKQFDAVTPLQNINRDIGIYSDKLNEIFKKYDELDKGVSTKELSDNFASKLTDSELKRSTLFGKTDNALSDISRVLNNISINYGKKISRAELDSIKTDIDNSLLKDTTKRESNLDKSIRLKLRESVREILENSIDDTIDGAKDIVKNLNNETGKLIEARNFLEKNINGQVLKGGRLLDHLRNVTAGQTASLVTAGLAGGSGSLLGPAGAILGGTAGYLASQKIGDILAKNTLGGKKVKEALKRVKKDEKILENADKVIKQKE